MAERPGGSLLFVDVAVGARAAAVWSTRWEPPPCKVREQRWAALKSEETSDTLTVRHLRLLVCVCVLEEPVPGLSAVFDCS